MAYNLESEEIFDDIMLEEQKTNKGRLWKRILKMKLDENFGRDKMKLGLMSFIDSNNINFINSSNGTSTN